MARLFIAALTAATMLLPGAFRQAAHAAEPEFTFSLNLAIPPTHQRWTQAIKPWVEEIEKRSAGRIKIEPYFAGALSSQQEVMESGPQRHCGHGRILLCGRRGALSLP